jgi:uncharacterized protein (DUF433 family)
MSRRLIGEEKTLTLINTIEVVGTTKAEIKAAFEVGFKDFEDAIQYTTALKIKNVKAIITRSTADYRKPKIAAFTPELFLKTQINT